MNKFLTLTAAFAFICSVAYAQEEKPAPADPFDLSAINEKIEELGIPTVQNVSQLESRALDLFQGGNCEDALPALESYARHANWLANIISSGLEPYYGASYDDRKNYSYRKLKPLIRLEKQANELRRKRDEAFVMQAECHAKLGDQKKAVALYIKALDLLSLDNDDWWTRARKGLYDIVGASAQ